jgi:sigma-E factor negative regulatory protein RseA
MKNLNSMHCERICDMVDGRLSEDECAQALQALASDPQAMQTWHAYHVVGDVLRSPELAPADDGLAFLAKLEQRLAQEPQRPRVADAARDAGVEQGAGRLDIVGLRAQEVAQPAANASVFRWKMVAGLACTALVGVLGMNLWSPVVQGKGAQMAARAPDPAAAPVVVAAEDGSAAVIRDPQLDELMAAHRQLGGHSALQVPAGFLRNATYEGSGR